MMTGHEKESFAKSEVNKIRNAKYLEKRNNIIQESDERIEEIKKLIEKEKQRKRRLLDLLDEEYQDLNDDPNAIIELNRKIIKLHIESTKNALHAQTAHNCKIPHDFTTKWHAQLIIPFDLIDICDRFQVSKFKNAFSDFNASDDSDYLIVAKATFFVIEIERFHKMYGKNYENLFNYGCFEIVDMRKAMEFSQNLPMFKAKHMNKHPLSNIVLIDKVEINPKLIGNGYGRNLVQRIMDNFGHGNTRFVLKPFPFYVKDENTVKYEQAREKVISVWESIGFRWIHNSKYWGRNCAFDDGKNNNLLINYSCLYK